MPVSKIYQNIVLLSLPSPPILVLTKNVFLFNYINQLLPQKTILYPPFIPHFYIPHFILIIFLYLLLYFFFIFVIIFLILFLLLFFITFFITFYFYFNIHRWCRNNKTFCFVLKKSSPLSKTLCSFLVGKYFLII